MTAGSAFPVFDGRSDADYGCADAGMTLHQYYIGQALAGVCQRADWDDGEEEVLARWAVDIADAVIALLEDRGKQ